MKSSLALRNLIFQLLKHAEMGKENIKKQNGVTLIELILSIAIISIFIVSLTYFSIDIFKAKAKSGAIVEVQENVRFAAQKMNYYIRNSETGINTGSSQFFPTDPGRLYLNMGAGAGDDVIFDVSSNRLRMSVGGTPSYLMSDEIRVTHLTFKNNSAAGTPGNVTVNMTVENNNPGGKREFTYSYDVETSVSLR